MTRIRSIGLCSNHFDVIDKLKKIDHKRSIDIYNYYYFLLIFLFDFTIYSKFKKKLLIPNCQIDMLHKK